MTETLIQMDQPIDGILACDEDVELHDEEADAYGAEHVDGPHV